MSNDLSERLSEIRERVEAATDEACPCCGGAFYWKGSGEAAVAEPGDVPYLLSLVEEVGEALAEFTESHLDRHVYEPLDQHGESEVADLLAALRDAAQEENNE